jgi:16S rRNA (cytidine1402-2'-O)-methyltransferase
VPTPVGNLEDITLRALRVLREVDLVLCEDTRTSRYLLQHHGINQHCIPYHIHNEHRQMEHILARIMQVKQVALISDAGTPGISDPGYLLIREALKQGITVECLPGPTAFVPALIQSGCPCDKFYFYGFLPHKKGKETVLQHFYTLKQTVVFYESPHRLLKTLAIMQNIWGADYPISIARELTKIHAETFRGSIREAIARYTESGVKGEITVVI